MRKRIAKKILGRVITESKRTGNHSITSKGYRVDQFVKAMDIAFRLGRRENLRKRAEWLLANRPQE